MNLLILFAALQAADAYTTYRVLSQGGRELNPIMSKAFEAFGHLPALFVIKGAAIGAIWYIHDMQYADYVIAALCVFYAGIVWHNWKQIK